MKKLILLIVLLVSSFTQAQTENFLEIAYFDWNSPTDRYAHVRSEEEGRGCYIESQIERLTVTSLTLSNTTLIFNNGEGTTTSYSVLGSEISSSFVPRIKQSYEIVDGRARSYSNDERFNIDQNCGIASLVERGLPNAVADGWYSIDTIRWQSLRPTDWNINEWAFRVDNGIVTSVASLENNSFHGMMYWNTRQNARGQHIGNSNFVDILTSDGTFRPDYSAIADITLVRNETIVDNTAWNAYVDEFYSTPIFTRYGNFFQRDTTRRSYGWTYTYSSDGTQEQVYHRDLRVAPAGSLGIIPDYVFVNQNNIVSYNNNAIRGCYIQGSYTPGSGLTNDSDLVQVRNRSYHQNTTNPRGNSLSFNVEGTRANPRFQSWLTEYDSQGRLIRQVSIYYTRASAITVCN